MKQSLYPITYKGKKYLEIDCNPVFVSYYTNKYALRFDGSVYVADGLSITPDGDWVDEE